MAFVVRFWGVRGSLACSSPKHITYGGNTSCVEMIVGDQRIVLDAGTGLRMLGNVLTAADAQTVHLLLSHVHWDHICGLPFFRPAFDPAIRMHIHAGNLRNQGGVRAALLHQMHAPLFPVPLSAMKAIVETNDFDAGYNFRLFSDIMVRTAPLNHPNGATGYRIEYAGKSACYVTDTEHVPGELDPHVLGLIEGADLVIYDSTYTEDEFLRHRGWGHSTWCQGMRLCQAAGAKTLAIFHHDPDHDDDFMAAMEAEARAAWSGTIVSRDGMAIEL